MKSIVFVMDYPQAKIKKNIYMTLPQVPNNFKISDLPNLSDRSLNVYKLVKNLYTLKDAGLIWNCHLRGGVKKR